MSNKEIIQDIPKLLVLSNTCFSKSSANGRTLGNFLKGWPKEKIAQFFLSGNPDGEFCRSFYQITDGQAIKAFCFKKISNGTIKELDINNTSNGNVKVAKKINKNALTMLLREMIWSNRRWKKYGFEEWVDNFKPELLLLQAGDSGFMCDLAVALSKKYNAPLVVYNSENYYFKGFDYFKSKGISHWMYPLFRKVFCRKFERMIKASAHSIYLCEELKSVYDDAFHLPSSAIYTATDISVTATEDNNRNENEFIVSYLGNMGVGRADALCEFAQVLSTVSTKASLDIYGKIPNDEVENKFAKEKNIRYKGFVQYDIVQKIMSESDLLIHVESFEPFYKEDLKYAFSTKIADSLVVGNCFLLYAPDSFACTKYLLNNEAAFVATTKEQLSEYLKLIINNVEERYRYKDNAQRLVANNHNLQKNAKLFQEILINAYKQ